MAKYLMHRSYTPVISSQSPNLAMHISAGDSREEAGSPTLYDIVRTGDGHSVCTVHIARNFNLPLTHGVSPFFLNRPLLWHRISDGFYFIFILRTPPPARGSGVRYLLASRLAWQMTCGPKAAQASNTAGTSGDELRFIISVVFLHCLLRTLLT